MGHLPPWVLLAAAEQVRRDFFPDGAPELWHLLTLLLGRIEALQDGVVPLDLGAVGQLHLAWAAMDLAPCWAG